MYNIYFIILNTIDCFITKVNEKNHAISKYIITILTGCLLIVIKACYTSDEPLFTTLSKISSLWVFRGIVIIVLIYYITCKCLTWFSYYYSSPLTRLKRIIDKNIDALLKDYVNGIGEGFSSIITLRKCPRASGWNVEEIKLNTINALSKNCIVSLNSIPFAVYDSISIQPELHLIASENHSENNFYDNALNLRSDKDIIKNLLNSLFATNDISPKIPDTGSLHLYILVAISGNSPENQKTLLCKNKSTTLWDASFTGELKGEDFQNISDNVNILKSATKRIIQEYAAVDNLNDSIAENLNNYLVHSFALDIHELKCLKCYLFLSVTLNNNESIQKTLNEHHLYKTEPLRDLLRKILLKKQHNFTSMARYGIFIKSLSCLRSDTGNFVKSIQKILCQRKI